MQEETQWTTITVPEHVKKDLDKERGSTPWGAFLEEMRQEYADPITLNDAEEIVERVSESVESSVDEDRLALATADYLMQEYELAEKVARKVRK